MSYEGTEHKLCRVGHLSAFDALDDFGIDEHGRYADQHVVCRCGEPFTHVFSQDETNGNDPENPHTMPPDFTGCEIEPDKYETCNLNHPHLVSEARYCVPDNGLWREIGKPSQD